jgi:uncharacterized protein YggT (Ycf19 family)
LNILIIEAMLSPFKASLLQLSGGDTGAIVALVVAIGIAGVAIIIVASRRSSAT